MKIVIPNERPPSWNDYYSGMHWANRVKAVNDIQWAVAAAVPEGTELCTKPVSITVTVYFDKRPLDSDNIPAKLYIDGLKGLVLMDDNLSCVRSVTTISRIDKEFPRVEIEIQEVVG
jgi:Holliday junction resolvase RusA-like endonuclease